MAEVAEKRAASVLLGFGLCPLCGGKSHVKRKDEPGKKAYSHCVDEHDMGCSHTHYATNARQEALMIEKMRPIKALWSAAPTPSEPSPPSPTATGSVNVEPVPAPAPTGKRRGLFGG